MSDYVDAQRKANEFNAQADDARLARLERGLGVVAQATLGLLAKSYPDEVNENLHSPHYLRTYEVDNPRRVRNILCELIADLQSPPKEEE